MVDESSKELLEQAYRQEGDPHAKERLLLVLRVRVDGVTAAQAAREVHRTKAWASKWLKKFERYGLDGLKDAPRSGRPPKIGSLMQLRIRTEMVERSQSWRVKEVWEFIEKESGAALSVRQVYRLLHRWGYRTVVPKKRFVKTASKEEKAAFKKGHRGSSSSYQRALP